MLGATQESIDEITDTPGFVDALKSIRPQPWIQVEADSVCIPRFETYMGKSAKQRAQNTLRAAKYRARITKEARPTATATETPAAAAEQPETREQDARAAAGAAAGKSFGANSQQPPSDNAYAEVDAALAAAGIGEPTRSSLVASGVGVRDINNAVAKARATNKGVGAIVMNLRNAVKVQQQQQNDQQREELGRRWWERASIEQQTAACEWWKTKRAAPHITLADAMKMRTFWRDIGDRVRQKREQVEGATEPPSQDA